MKQPSDSDDKAVLSPDRQLDVSGSMCPVPVVRARQALKSMNVGEVLEVIATDPLAELDLAVMCDHTGHRWRGASTDNGVLRVRIEVVGPETETATTSEHQPDAD